MVLGTDAELVIGVGRGLGFQNVSSLTEENIDASRISQPAHRRIRRQVDEEKEGRSFSKHSVNSQSCPDAQLKNGIDIRISAQEVSDHDSVLNEIIFQPGSEHSFNTCARATSGIDVHGAAHKMSVPAGLASLVPSVIDPQLALGIGFTCPRDKLVTQRQSDPACQKIQETWNRDRPGIRPSEAGGRTGAAV